MPAVDDTRQEPPGSERAWAAIANFSNTIKQQERHGKRTADSARPSLLDGSESKFERHGKRTADSTLGTSKRTKHDVA